MLKSGESGAGCTCPTTVGKNQFLCPNTNSTACVCSSGAAAATGILANVNVKNGFDQTITTVAVQYVNAAGVTTCASRM